MLDWLVHAKFLEAGHAVEWISGITGAGGAILGSLVTVLSTEIFNGRKLKRDDARENHISALAIFNKLNKIYSQCLTIHQHYSEFNTQYRPTTGPKCLSFMPLSVSDREVWFTMEERKAVLNSGGKKIAQSSGLRLLNRMLDLDERYNFLTKSALKYGPDREKLMDSFTATEALGIVGPQFEITPLQQVKANSLDMYIDQVFPVSKEIGVHAFEALQDLVYLPGKPLGNGFSISLPDPDGVIIELKAVDAPSIKKWYFRRETKTPTPASTAS